MPEQEPVRVWVAGQLLTDPRYDQDGAGFDLVLAQPDGQELAVGVMAGPDLAGYLKSRQARQRDTILVVGTVGEEDGRPVLTAQVICCGTSLDGSHAD